MDNTLTFLGAAGTVTGSRFLLEHDRHRYLIDCGLFQGSRKMKAKNWEPFPVDPSTIEAVLLTHAHIDHVGYLPRLVAQGYRGPIYATRATSSLLELLLPDAAYLQEQEATYANKKGYSRHKPALPLFTSKDAEQALRLIQPFPFGARLSLESAEAVWRPSGHILGAGILEMNLDQGSFKRLVFSGDLGRYRSEIMKPPTTITEADILLIESTYGNRSHEDEPIEELLSVYLQSIAESGGVLLIPAFAVGRTQQILYWLRKAQESGAPDLPVFIDSPMAVEASHLYCEFGDDHNLDVNLLMDERRCPLRCRETHFVRDVAESKELNHRAGPAVIISASGMCTGGRILHHLKWRLPHAGNIVLFVGYQAERTRGRQLLGGAEKVRIHGQEVPVRAKIENIHALSAHADREELFRWASGFESPPSRTFIVHGEADGSQALKDRLVNELGWQVTIPLQNDITTL